MTLPPSKIGDHGQRFEVRWRWPGDAPDSHRVVGWSADRVGAEGMRDTMAMHPSAESVWVVDREIDAK